MIPDWIDPILDSQGNCVSFGVDSRALILDNTGDILSTLFDYALDINEGDIIFPQVIFVKDKCLHSNFKLPRKNKVSHMLDMVHSVNAYKNIAAIFLTLNITRNVYSNKVIKEKFDRAQNYFWDSGSVLEFYLLNNPDSIKNQRSYHTGKSELTLLRVVQEIYELAANGEKTSQWMLSFSSPFQIWIVLLLQDAYIKWFRCLSDNTSKRDIVIHANTLKEKSIREYENNVINYEKDFIPGFNLNIKEAFDYTLQKIIVQYGMQRTPSFNDYLEILYKQALALRKGTRKLV